MHEVMFFVIYVSACIHIGQFLAPIIVRNMRNKEDEKAS